MTLLRRFAKGGSCCGSGSLVPVDDTATGTEHVEAKASDKCCNDPTTCC